MTGKLIILLVIALTLHSLNAGDLTIQIYDGDTGTLKSSFQNWSWGTVNLQDTTVVRPGSKYSASLVVKGYQALFLEGNFILPAGDLSTLSFWVNGGPQGGQSVNLVILSNNKGIGNTLSLSTLYGGPIPANKWIQIVVTFSAFGVEKNTQIDGIWLQAGSNDDQGTIYFDDIEFSAQGPTPQPVTVVVKNQNRQSVSRYIYGANFATFDQLSSIGYTVNRWGGNSVTRYSWDIDVNNHANDWFFEDIANTDDPSKLPNGTYSDQLIANTTKAGARTLLTTPMIGWRPFDRQKRCGFSVSKYGAQQQTDPYDTDCGNGVNKEGKNIVGNDPHDTSIETNTTYNVKWIQHLDSVFGKGTVRWFIMDNEPGLWSSTHRDVHPIPLSYDELWSRTLSYGGALKAAYPEATLFGPAVWGWCAYMFSPLDGCSDGADRRAHGDLPLLQWYIQQIVNHKKSTGQQLIDVIDFHFYPQAPGVSGNSEDPITAFLRLSAPRSLFDPTYTDPSWIAQPIFIAKRISDWIQQYNPGSNSMRFSVSEFSYGSDTLITSALATTETLGILANLNALASTIWTAPTTGSAVENAYLLYLNYDQKGSKVTGDNIYCNSTHYDVVSSFAYDDAARHKLFVVLINKISTQPVPVTVDVSGITRTGSIEYYGFSKNNRVKLLQTGTVASGSFLYNIPAWTATVAVISY